MGIKRVPDVKATVRPFEYASNVLFKNLHGCMKTESSDWQYSQEKILRIDGQHARLCPRRISLIKGSSAVQNAVWKNF